MSSSLPERRGPVRIGDAERDHDPVVRQFIDGRPELEDALPGARA